LAAIDLLSFNIGFCLASLMITIIYFSSDIARKILRKNKKNFNSKCHAKQRIKKAKLKLGNVQLNSW
jgi:hypothetical protein